MTASSPFVTWLPEWPQQGEEPQGGAPWTEKQSTCSLEETVSEERIPVRLNTGYTKEGLRSQPQGPFTVEALGECLPLAAMWK